MWRKKDTERRKTDRQANWRMKARRERKTKKTWKRKEEQEATEYDKEEKG